MTEAIRKSIGELAGAIKVTVTRKNSRKQKMAIVEMNVNGTEELFVEYGFLIT